MLILDLWGISFHPAVVVGLGYDLLFNFSVGHCGTSCIFFLVIALPKTWVSYQYQSYNQFLLVKREINISRELFLFSSCLEFRLLACNTSS